VVAFAKERLKFEPDEKQALALRGGRRGIVLCTRQWGKSTVMAVKAAHRAYTSPGSLVLALAPCARQSGEFVRKARMFIVRIGIRLRGHGDNPMSIPLPNGSRIVGLPHNEDKVRGFSNASLILIDEASRVSDSLYLAMRPTLAVGDGDLWLMSTPNGRRGFFWEEWDHGGGHWERICVTAPECPRISARFLAEERAREAEKFFRQEYLCEFVEREGAVFSQESIDKAMQDFEPLYL
jgi:terminase large subunit-like protein